MAEDEGGTELLTFGGLGRGTGEDMSEAEFFGDGDSFGDSMAPEPLRRPPTSSFQEERSTRTKEWPCSLRYQFLMNTAQDCLEEVLAENRWRKQGSNGADASWVGLLCRVDEFIAYGFVTTNVRYIALVEDSISPDNAQQHQISHQNDIKLFLANVHNLYVEYLLNPFSDPHSKIVSRRFDIGLTNLAQKINEVKSTS